MSTLCIVCPTVLEHPILSHNQSCILFATREAFGNFAWATAGSLQPSLALSAVTQHGIDLRSVTCHLPDTQINSPTWLRDCSICIMHTCAERTYLLWHPLRAAPKRYRRTSCSCSGCIWLQPSLSPPNSNRAFSSSHTVFVDTTS